MSLRSRNFGRVIWLALLTFALLLPSANNAVAAIQEEAEQESTGEVQQAEAAAAAQIKEVLGKALDPEGMTGTPTTIAPPPIQAERNIAEEVTQETTAPQTMAPRVALRPTKVQDWGTEQPVAGQQQATQPFALTSNPTINPISPNATLATESTYQTPQLRLTTLGPKQANIHRSSQFRFRVTNDGPITAEGVNLVIDINGSGRVISTFPANGVQQTSSIYFPIGDLPVGAIKEFGFEFQANQAGQVTVAPRLTSSATTTFTANITAPKVKIDIQGSDNFVVGQKVIQTVVIHNEGTETVRNLVVRQACTPTNAFDAASIKDGQHIIDAIVPGESRAVEISAIAVQQGKATMKVVVDGENVRGVAGKDFTFLQSQLTASIEGPELTYLNSMGTYAITLANDQHRDIENVNVRLTLPVGMVVKVVDRKAEFDAASSSIAWTIPKLEAGKSETIPFKATLSQFGQHVVKISVSNDAGAMTHAQMNTQAVGRADIDVKVITNSEPIEIGATTSIIVQVQNRGTQPASDVAVSLNLPDTFKGIESADYAMDGQLITFDNFRLGPGQTQNLTVPITCSTAGDHIVRATVESSASTKKIGAENSLFFFSNSTTETARRATDNK